VAKRKILIVDDLTADASELGARLTHLGYEVTAIASSETEASERSASPARS